MKKIIYILEILLKDKLKYLLLVIFLLVQILYFNSQINIESVRANHWYFGNKAGLDFTSGNPVVDLSSVMYQEETGSVISDLSGNILFYTNGDTIWNKNHQVMPNGTGLVNCQSASQGGLIIKKPGSVNLYYVFTNDCAENNGVSGVHYSIVDVNLNAGLGAVTTKNILLYAPSTEKLTAVYHCNNNDVWIIGQIRNSNQFCAYLLNNIGINVTPVISTIGYFHHDDAIPVTGAMKFSPSREKLAIVYSIYNPNGIEELYDFDSETGSIFNLTTLPPDTSEYGVSFSNDNQKLYIQAGGGGGIANKIFQYDLSSNTPSLIANSKTLIHSNHWNNPVIDLQNGVDGKIYGTRFYLDSVAVINNPQLAGSLCNYNHTAISLNGRVCRENFPQYNENYFFPTQTNATACTTGIKNHIKDAEISVFPNPIIDYFIIKNENHEKVFVEIKNIMGNNFYAKEYSEGEIKVNVSDIEKGIYILNIKTYNKVKTTKLIIN